MDDCGRLRVIQVVTSSCPHRQAATSYGDRCRELNPIIGDGAPPGSTGRFGFQNSFSSLRACSGICVHAFLKHRTNFRVTRSGVWNRSDRRTMPKSTKYRPSSGTIGVGIVGPSPQGTSVLKSIISIPFEFNTKVVMIGPQSKERP